MDQLDPVSDLALIVLVMSLECRDASSDFPVRRVGLKALKRHDNGLLHFVTEYASNPRPSLLCSLCHIRLPLRPAYSSLESAL